MKKKKDMLEGVLIYVHPKVKFPPVKMEGSELPSNIRYAFQQMKNLESVNHKTENELRTEFLTLLVEGHIFVDEFGRLFSPDTEAAKAAVRRLHGKKNT